MRAGTVGRVDVGADQGDCRPDHDGSAHARAQRPVAGTPVEHCACAAGSSRALMGRTVAVPVRPCCCEKLRGAREQQLGLLGGVGLRLRLRLSARFVLGAVGDAVLAGNACGDS